VRSTYGREILLKTNKKYLVAVALLAVLAVVFGLAGTVAPMSEPVSPQPLSSFPSVTHFVNPPTFDSAWMDITDKAGQSFNITHDLNTTEALIDVAGRQSLTSDDHKLFFGSTVYIQELNKTYGGTPNDWAYSLVRTNDGGYVSAGATIPFGAAPSDFWLVKINSDLNVEWNQTYGGPWGDMADSVVQTSDGGYALAGSTWSASTGFDFWLVKTDSAGNMLWNQTYGGGKDDWSHTVVQTSDGGYALAGYTNSYGAGRRDFWLVKTDSTGNAVWNQTYGGTDDDEAQSVVQTSDGGYALAGSTLSYGAGSSDFWLVKSEVGELGFSMGLSMTDFANSTITFYRGSADPFWSYVRVRIWTIQEPTWQFGDIDMDGEVDLDDLFIVLINYGETFSVLSLTGIVAVAGIHIYRKRKQPK